MSFKRVWLSFAGRQLARLILLATVLMAGLPPGPGAGGSRASPQILQRAADYAESRLICGMHFPSDIEAGRVMAVAVVEHIKSSPAFREDMLCAQAEFNAASGKGALPDSCSALQ